MIGLRLNAVRLGSQSVHNCTCLVGGQWVSGTPSSCYVALPFTRLPRSEAATFLDAQVGFNVVPSFATLAEIIAIGQRSARSKLR